jgi:hypothetical protein
MVDCGDVLNPDRAQLAALADDHAFHTGTDHVPHAGPDVVLDRCSRLTPAQIRALGEDRIIGIGPGRVVTPDGAAIRMTVYDFVRASTRDSSEPPETPTPSTSEGEHR